MKNMKIISNQKVLCYVMFYIKIMIKNLTIKYKLFPFLIFMTD